MAIEDLGGLLGMLEASPEDKRTALNQGLLAAGFGLLGSPSPRLGPALAQGGLAGMGAYQQGLAQARDQRMDTLKMRMLLQQLADKQRRQKALEDFASRYGQAPSPEQQALAGGQGPTMEAAQALGQLRANPQSGGTAIPGITREALQADIALNEGKNIPEWLFKANQPTEFQRDLQASGLTPQQQAIARQHKFGIGEDVKMDYLRRDPATGAWKVDPELFNLHLLAKRAGAPQNKIDLKVGDSLAGGIREIAASTRSAALAGIKLADSSQRIIDAAMKGNAMTGPGANARLLAAQTLDLLGVSGKDMKEKIANTRTLIQGLAEQSVAARSQLGSQAQISNAEQALLSRAVSGDITDMTMGEVLQIARLNKRMARQMYGLHETTLEGIRSEKDPAIRRLDRYYKVPDFPDLKDGLERSVSKSGRPMEKREDGQWYYVD